jgi:recombination protein RecA
MIAMTLTDDYIESFEQEVGEVTPTYVVKPLRRLSFGLRSLDMVLYGGVPAGYITELIGIEDCGKSTLLLHLLAENGGILIDSDGHYDPAYAKRIGAQPLLANLHGVSAVNTVVTEFLKEGELVVIDSLAALVTYPEGRPVRFDLNTLVPFWRSLASEFGGTLVVVDQLRFRGGVGYHQRAEGGPVVTANSVMRLQLRPFRGDVLVEVLRDLHHPESRRVMLDVEEQYGFSKAGAQLDAMVALGELTVSGSWYAWPDGTLIAQGREAAKKAL